MEHFLKLIKVTAFINRYFLIYYTKLQDFAAFSFFNVHYLYIWDQNLNYAKTQTMGCHYDRYGIYDR